MVPKEITEEQKQRRVTNSQNLLERQDDILGRIITGDEIWVYKYDPETKPQSAQWKTAYSPRPKKSVVPNQETNKFVEFFILEGLLIMNLYQLDKQTNKFIILEYWKCCVKKLDGKDPKFCQNSWILHHDNAPAHTVLSVREILATKQITVLEHPT